MKNLYTKRKTMFVPVIEGLIRRRILANYRVDPDVIQALLPAPFRPKLVHGAALAGICLIRLEQVRPQGLPARVGVASENAAHRIAVTWEAEGRTHEGVYIPRRDSDSRLTTLVGGRLFPGEHHHAHFTTHDDPQSVAVQFRSADQQVAVRVAGRRTASFPTDSVFGSLDAASAFFAAGALGYSATRRLQQFDGITLDCRRWAIEPLAVDMITSSFFDDAGRFPARSITFDCALLMRDIPHTWHAQAPLCVTVEQGAAYPRHSA
jgi:uncharacterized protein YqjF (DUF2071 family)